jgi:branched-chain amino acid transport system permease protein
MAQAIVFGIVNGALYGLLALGIVMIYRGTKVLSFAQPELGTVAAFVTWFFVVRQGWPWLVAAAIGLSVCVGASLVFERLVIRPMADAPRLSVTVATVGMMLLTIAVQAKVWGGSPRYLPGPIDGQGVRIVGVFVSPTAMLAIVTVAVLGLGITWFLRRSDFGLGVLAASQDTVAARLNGVPVHRVSMFTWGVAGLLAGMAALFIAPALGATTYGMMISWFVFAMAAALIGGLTNLTGAFVGGLIVGILTEVSRYLFLRVDVPGPDTILVFVLIVGVLLLRPHGLLGRAGRAA